MYERISNRPLTQSQIDQHHGTAQDWMRLYRGRAYQAACAGKEAVRQFMPRTMKRIADHRNLDVAFHHIAVHGGEAPGPSGLALADLTGRQLLDMIKIVSQQIADGSYRPGPERRLNVSKSGGNGTRPLKLQNIEDRGVGRALLQVLQPLVDATFDSRSFGSRPHLGRLDALAEAAVLCTHEERTIWLAVDVKDAFEQVPHNRLLDVVRDRLPDDGLLVFLRILLHNERNKGLRQGSPFSPFLCNLYLDHFLDRPWRKRHPDVPLVRYLDDVLVLCRTGDDVSGLQADLLDMLRRCGMSAKPVGADNRCDLVAGEGICWLGYEIRLGRSGLEFRLPVRDGRPEWLERLHEKFSLAHAGSHAQLIAWRAIDGLADQLGPVFRFEDLAALWPAIEALAREHAFLELPDLEQFSKRVSRSNKRWRKLCRTTTDLHTSLAASEPTSGLACDHWQPGVVPAKQFVLTCDGSFIRPRSGGWAFVLIDRSNKEKLIRFGGRNCTSASHAELCAAIRGLSMVPRGAAVLLVSDSRYVADGISNLPTWKCDRWQSASGPLKHVKLWKRMDRLLQHRSVTCRWVPGHSGHRLHDLCDALAGRAADDHATGHLPEAIGLPQQ